MNYKLISNLFRLMLENKTNIARVIQAKLTKKYCKDLFVANSKEAILFEIILRFFDKYSKSISREELTAFLESTVSFSSELKKEILFLYESCSFEIEYIKDINIIVDLIKQEYSLKKLSEVAENTARQNPEDAIESYKKTIQSLDILTRNDVFEGAVGALPAERKAEYEMRQSGLIKGLLTGFSTFDSATNGLYNGSLYMVMAPTKHGKSLFLLNVGYNIQISGHNVLYITLENSKDTTELRYESLNSGLPYEAIKKGILTPEQKEIYYKSIDASNAMKSVFYICDVHDDCTVPFLMAKYKELSYDRDFDLVIVDYINFMKPTFDKKDDWLNQSNICKDLRSFARMINKPVFTAAQISHEGWERIKKSGRLEATDSGGTKMYAKHVDLMMGMIPMVIEDVGFKDTFDLKASITASRDSRNVEFMIRAEAFKMRMTEQPFIVDDVPALSDGPSEGLFGAGVTPATEAL